MKILHYNDEERELHHYLAERGHENVVLPASADPFALILETAFDAAFIGLHPHGFQLIRQLLRKNGDCLVTMITADQNARLAVEAMKLGAFDYLLTPLDFAEVDRTVIMMMREHQGQKERAGLEGRLARHYSLDDLDSNIGEGAPGVHQHQAPGPLRQTLATAEERAIRQSLETCRGNIAEAARSLDISRTTLYSKMEIYGIARPESRAGK